MINNSLNDFFTYSSSHFWNRVGNRKQLPKDAVLKTMPYEDDRLMKAIDPFNDDELIIPGGMELPDPGQSYKDNLAHLAAWEQSMIDIIKAIVDDKEIPKYPTARKLNLEIFYANKNRPLEDVQNAFTISYLKIYEFVKNLTTEQFSIDEVWRLVGYNTYNHYR